MHIKLNDIKSENNNHELTLSDSISEIIERKIDEITVTNEFSELSIPSIDLVFFFDKSGSVAGTEESMSKYTEKLLNKYKSEKMSVFVSLILFNSDEESLYFRTPIRETKKINYQADGGTNFYDTVFTGINKILDSQIDTNSASSKTIVTIMTDGEDNSSTKYRSKDLKKLIEYTKTLGWEYVYLTENKKTIEKIGIDSNHIGLYKNQTYINECFNSIEKAIDGFIESGKISSKWNDNLPGKVLKIGKIGD